MSICYLDMTLSLHKRKDRVLTLCVRVCTRAYVCVLSHLLLYICNEYQNPHSIGKVGQFSSATQIQRTFSGLRHLLSLKLELSLG